MKQTTVEGRLRWSEITLQSTLRYTTTLLLAEYAASSIADIEVDRYVLRLERPTLGQQMEFVRDMPKRLYETGHSWFCDEIPTALHRIRGMQSVPGQRLLEYLVRFRRDVQHVDNEVAENEATDFESAIARILWGLTFLEELKLFICVEDEHKEGEKRYVGLMGAEEISGRPHLDLKSFDQPPRWNAFVFRHVTQKALPLDPFVRYKPCADCMKDHLTNGRELFLIEGSEKGQGFFRGEKHGYFAAHDNPLQELLASKACLTRRTHVTKLAASELLSRVCSATEQLIAARKRDLSYLPELMVERVEIESQLESFASNDKTLFLLTGASGSGKSSILYRWAESRLRDQQPTLILDGSRLDVDYFYEEILRLIGAYGEQEEFLQSLTRLPKPVVIIDGVNEHPSPLQVLRTLRTVAEDCIASKLKLVVSCRTSQALDVFEADLTSQLGHNIYHVALRDGVQRFTHVLTAIDRSDSLLERVFNLYRETSKTSNGTPLRFRPLTCFEDVTASVRALATNPGALRQLMQTYHGRELPQQMGAADLTQAFLQESIFQDELKGTFIKRLALEFVRRRVVALSTRDISEVADLLPGMTGTPYERAPFQQLLDTGVLRLQEATGKFGMFEMPQRIVRFALDGVLEFLIASLETMQPDFGPDRLKSALIEAGSFPPFEGATEIVWEMVSKNDDGKLFIETIDLCVDGLGIRAISSTLAKMRSSRPDVYASVLRYILNKHAFYDLLTVLLLDRQLGSEGQTEAQFEIWSSLLEWKGEDQDLVRMEALGRLLLLGFTLGAEDKTQVRLFNQLQTSLSDITGSAPFFYSEDSNLSPADRTRMEAVAYSCRYAFSDMIESKMGRTTGDPFIEAVTECGISSLSRKSRLRLHGMKLQLANRRALESSPEMMAALEQAFELISEKKIGTAVRTFAHHDIDLLSTIESEIPKVEAEIAIEIRVLLPVLLASIGGSLSGDVVVDRTLNEYARFKLEPDRILSSDEAVANISIIRVLVDFYTREGNFAQAIDLCDLGVQLAPSVYGFQHMKALENLQNATILESGGSNDIRRSGRLWGLEHASLLYRSEIEVLCNLDLRYLVLSGQWGDRLSKLPFEYLTPTLLNDYVQKEFRDRQWHIMYGVARPWLSQEQRNVAVETDDPNELYNFLSTIEPSLPRIFAKQFLIEVLATTAVHSAVGRATSGRPVDGPDPFEVDEVNAILDDLLMAGAKNAAHLGSLGAADGDRLWSHDAYGTILNGWDSLSSSERVLCIVKIALIDQFASLAQLHTNVAFCERIGSEPGTEQAKLWIHSVIRCWTSGLASGQWANCLDDLLKNLDQCKVLLGLTPGIVLVEVGWRVAWAELQRLTSIGNSLLTLAQFGSPNDIDSLVVQVRELCDQKPHVLENVITEVSNDLATCSDRLLAEFG